MMNANYASSPARFSTLCRSILRRKCQSSFPALVGVLTGHLLADQPSSPTDSSFGLATPGSSRTLVDTDGDGWDDLWVSLFPKIDRTDFAADDNHDGITNYLHMLGFRDPYSDPQPYSTAESQARENLLEEERLAAQTSLWSQRRAVLAPYLHEPFRLAGGQPASVHEVEADQKAAAAQLSAVLTEQALKDEAATEIWCQENGIPRVQFAPDGRAVGLEMRNGVLCGVAAPSYEAASWMEADRLLPGGTPSQLWSGLTPLVLNGAGMRVGYWDVGTIRVTHQEFYVSPTVQRVENKQAGQISDHATAGAGILAAAGVVPGRGGLAPAVSVHGRSYDAAVSEVLATVNSATTTDDLSVACLNMVDLIGWTDNTGGNPNGWIWWGNSAISLKDWRFGFYNDRAAQADQVGYAAPKCLMVFAAGNEAAPGPHGGPSTNSIWHYEFSGGQTYYTSAFRYLDGQWPGNAAFDKFDSLASWAVAKNVLTVGAATISGVRWASPTSVTIAAYSSRGPTDDGRIKPDVVASAIITNTPGSASDTATSGLGGTSSAVPEVAGALILVAEAWKTLHPSQPEIRSDTLKALAIHTASECGPHPGPDYTHGWGLLNAEAAAVVIAQDAASACHAQIKETTLSTGGMVSFPVTASGQRPLKVTLVWLDPAHAILPNADNPLTPHLVNDLDLVVTGSDQVPFYPFRLTRDNPIAPPLTDAPNHRDTVEQVLISNPAAGGTYQVTITPTGTLQNQNGTAAPQKLSLVITGALTVPGPEFRITVFSQTGPSTYTLGWPANVGCVYRIQSSTDLQTWDDLPGDLPANLTLMTADVPVIPEEPQKFYRVTLIE